MKRLTATIAIIACTTVICEINASEQLHVQSDTIGHDRKLDAVSSLQIKTDTSNNSFKASLCTELPNKHKTTKDISINITSDDIFKRPYPVLLTSKKAEGTIKIPQIEKLTDGECINKGTFNLVKMRDTEGLTCLGGNKIETTELNSITENISTNPTEQQSSMKSILKISQHKRCTQITYILPEDLETNTPEEKKILGKKRLIENNSNERQLNNFLMQNFNGLNSVDNATLEKQISTLAKFIYSDPNDSVSFHNDKYKLYTIHALTQEIGQRFFIKPLFLFKFSRSLITNDDKIRRFNSFWRLLLMRNVLKTKKISYINEQKQTASINIENDNLINAIENIVKKYIDNSEWTIKKIICSIKKLKHLDATNEYEPDQIRCFISALQNSNEIREISWNITLNDGCISDTIGALFDNKIHPILNEYFSVFNTVANYIKQQSK